MKLKSDSKVEKGKREKHKDDEPLFHATSEEKDPYRWVTIVLFLFCLFVTYVFWVQDK